MQFRLLHLLVVFVLVAIGLFSLDQYVRDTAIVRFSSSTAVDQDFITTTLNQPLSLDRDVDYQIPFEIQNASQTVSGCAFGKYGHNRLLATELTESSVSQFEGRTIKIGYRRHALPWMPATQVLDELNEHFLSVWTICDADQIENR